MTPMLSAKPKAAAGATGTALSRQRFRLCRKRPTPVAGPTLSRQRFRRNRESFPVIPAPVAHQRDPARRDPAEEERAARI
jgi:hypothetical protein